MGSEVDNFFDEGEERDKFFDELNRLAGQEPPNFPTMFYNEDGGHIEIYFDNEAFHACWISHHLTLYISDETNKVCGMEIKINKNTPLDKLLEIIEAHEKAMGNE